MLGDGDSLSFAANKPAAFSLSATFSLAGIRLDPRLYIILRDFRPVLYSREKHRSGIPGHASYRAKSIDKRKKKEINAIGGEREKGRGGGEKKITAEVSATRNLFKEVRRKGRTCVGQ